MSWPQGGYPFNSCLPGPHEKKAPLVRQMRIHCPGLQAGDQMMRRLTGTSPMQACCKLWFAEGLPIYTDSILFKSLKPHKTGAGFSRQARTGSSTWLHAWLATHEA